MANQEHVNILANMSRFVIADITNAKSIPQELQAIVPNLPSVPIQPIIHIDDKEYAMFESLRDRMLPIFRYQDIPSLLVSFKERILKPIEQKESEKEKNRSLEEEKEKNRSLEEENSKLKERIRELEELAR